MKISQSLKLKSKDITSKTLHTNFYASRIKASELRVGKIRPPGLELFKSPGKIGLNQELFTNGWEAVRVMRFEIRLWTILID